MGKRCAAYFSFPFHLDGEIGFAKEMVVHDWKTAHTCCVCVSCQAVRECAGEIESRLHS